MINRGTVAQTVGSAVLLALAAVPIWRGQQIQPPNAAALDGVEHSDGDYRSPRQLFEQSPSYAQWVDSIQQLAEARARLVDAATEPDAEQVSQAAADYRSRVLAVRGHTEQAIARMGLETGVEILRNLTGPRFFDLLPDSLRDELRPDELPR